ncbi:MAG: GWxTD domain-containing protein, partial [Calditrichia bacterium]
MFILILLLFSLAWTQPEGREYKEVTEFRPPGNRFSVSKRINPVLFRFYPAAVSPDSFRVYFIGEVMYDFLQFINIGDNFGSGFQFEVRLSSDKREQVFLKTWAGRLSTEKFAGTNLRNRFALSIDSLVMPAGDYQAKVRYSDLNGEQKRLYNFRLHLPQPDSLYASPPLFGIWGKGDSLRAAPFPFRPQALREHLIFNRPYGILLNGWHSGRQPVTAKLRILSADSLLFSKDTLLSNNADPGTLITPPFLQWPPGDYQLRIGYEAGSQTKTQQLDFSIIWPGSPVSIDNPDAAIRPLRVILSEEEYDELDSGNSTEKLAAFNKFWKSKDPTPETAYNEVMVEFYRRVRKANREYGSSGIPGWRTDPGRIYIKYGPPDEVRDQSLHPEEP